MAPGISDLRESIDRIDRQIVQLLAERLELVKRVGEIKRGHGLNVHDPARERDLLDKVAKAAPEPLTPDIAERIFQCIIQESRNLEQRHVTAISSAKPTP
jgi:chorismate mutase-like protein